MIAIDTNLLVYAHREEMSWHREAYDAVRRLAEGTAPWALLWPVIHEFLAIVTHPRIFNPPTPIVRAIDQVDAWIESPSVHLLAEGRTYWGDLSSLISRGKVRGPQVHDARIAALCLHHGIRELWTADRDFSRFPSVKLVNPLS